MVEHNCFRNSLLYRIEIFSIFNFQLSIPFGFIIKHQHRILLQTCAGMQFIALASGVYNDQAALPSVRGGYVAFDFSLGYRPKEWPGDFLTSRRTLCALMLEATRSPMRRLPDRLRALIGEKSMGCSVCGADIL